jgi:hypothetical protein
MEKVIKLPYLLLIYIFMCIYQFKISILKGSDDSIFEEVHKHTPYLTWITSRYNTWSGRIFPDTVVYYILDYLWLWKLITSLLLLLLTIYIVKILKKDVTRKELIISIFVLSYISSNVLNTGFFWITGSINYLWPISLGFVAMYPFANKIFNYSRKISPIEYTGYLIAGILASISNEQVALCMSAFSLISLFILIVKRKEMNILLIILAIIFIVGTGIELLAPGNKVRWAAEVGRWFPGFDHLSLKAKLHIGVVWLYQEVFGELRNTILLLSLTVIALYYKATDSKKTPFYIFSVMVFLVLSSMFVSYTEIFFDFKLITQYSLSNIFVLGKKAFIHAVFPYAFWTVYSILMIYLIMLKTKQKLFVFLCLGAALATFVLMFFSPTIYASGTRTLTLGAVLLSFVTVKLIVEFDLAKNKAAFLILGCLPLLNLYQIFMNFK